MGSRHERFVDDMAGRPLDPDVRRATCRTELDYVASKAFRDLRKVQEALAKTGRPPISVRWVEFNKGDDEHPTIRSRLVARDIRMAGEDAIFAPTPPFESLRMVLSYAVTHFPKEPRAVFDPALPERSQVLLIGISRAYFSAVTPEDEPAYVELPPEFGAPPGTCA